MKRSLKCKSAETVCCGYCGQPGVWFIRMLSCANCNQWFHEGCVKCLEHELLIGDLFYLFLCTACNQDRESVKRIELNWTELVHLVLFHIAVEYGGRLYDLTVQLLPWINDNIARLQSDLLNKTSLEQQQVEIENALKSNQNRFVNGLESRQRKSCWRLRLTSVPDVPIFERIDSLGQNVDVPLDQCFVVSGKKLPWEIRRKRYLPVKKDNFYDEIQKYFIEKPKRPRRSADSVTTSNQGRTKRAKIDVNSVKTKLQKISIEKKKKKISQCQFRKKEIISDHHSKSLSERRSKINVEHDTKDLTKNTIVGNDHDIKKLSESRVGDDLDILDRSRCPIVVDNQNYQGYPGESTNYVITMSKTDTSQLTERISKKIAHCTGYLKSVVNSNCQKVSKEMVFKKPGRPFRDPEKQKACVERMRREFEQRLCKGACGESGERTNQRLQQSIHDDVIRLQCSQSESEATTCEPQEELSSLLFSRPCVRSSSDHCMQQDRCIHLQSEQNHQQSNDASTNARQTYEDQSDECIHEQSKLEKSVQASQDQCLQLRSKQDECLLKKSKRVRFEPQRLKDQPSTRVQRKQPATKCRQAETTKAQLNPVDVLFRRGNWKQQVPLTPSVSLRVKTVDEQFQLTESMFRRKPVLYRRNETIFKKPSIDKPSSSSVRQYLNAADGLGNSFKVRGLRRGLDGSVQYMLEWL